MHLAELFVTLDACAEPLKGEIEAVRPELDRANVAAQCGPVFSEDPVGVHQGGQKGLGRLGVIFTDIVVLEFVPCIVARQAQFGDGRQ